MRDGRRARGGVSTLLLAFVVLGAACPSPPAAPRVTAGPTNSPPASDSCAERTLAGMSADQRVGQLFLFGLEDNRLGPAEVEGIREDHLGSVAFIETTSAGSASIRETTDAVQALATEANTAGVGFLVAANQEGGQIQALRGPGFSTIPSAVEQGGLDPADLRARARTWGEELLAAGVNFDFAPVMDVVPPGRDDENEPIGVLQRGYGHDPATVSSHGTAFQRGMQDAGVVTSPKHFPGLGRVIGNTDFTADVVDDETTSDDPYLEPFADAVAAGVPFVMVALATYTQIDPDRLAVFSPTVIEDLLRGSLGFEGVVISDDVGAAEAVARVPTGDRAVDFLEAGGNMVISKFVGPARAMARAVRSRAEADPAFRALADASALRILAAKDAAGLLPC
ncbi:MAG: glycoside hydrolase family 3 N-terminal domain-containing protein [Actinomycetota bacterium]